MAKKVKNSKKDSALKDPIKNVKSNGATLNGLSDAIMGFQPGGPGVQLSQTETLFKNNRWYLISNMRQLVSECMVEHGIIKTIIDVPVDDGLRGGVEIKSKQLSPEEIEKLSATMDKEDDLTTMGQAMKWNRGFGGAGVIIMTDQDPMTPLDIDAITQDTPLEFKDCDMWELFFTLQNTSDYAAAINGDELAENEFFNYYGVQVHHSRVMLLKGIKAPSFIRPRLRGWGLSVLETLVRSINQYLKANNLIFEVLDEFKIDVYKIKDLASTLMSEGGSEKVRQRIQLANMQKNYQNAISMDTEDDFLQKELSFTGVAETMTGIRMQIASDMRMPLTKIFGISAAGFSSGEDDIENYNSMVESEIRQKAKYHILKMIEIRCQKLFGYVPDDIQISFKPLRMLSAEQEENVKTQQFNRLLQSLQAGAIDAKTFKDGCNAENLLPVQIQDMSNELLQVESDEESNDATKDSAPKSTKVAKDAPEVKNAFKFDLKNSSAEFDRSAYQADGGDGQFSMWHKRQVDDPGTVDSALMSKAREFGQSNWKMVLWYYLKYGGKFE